jgi:hypothetical protein
MPFSWNLACEQNVDCKFFCNIKVIKSVRVAS